MINGNKHKEDPNWLLYFLIVVSIAIHAGFFFQASGRFNLKKTSYIEIGVRKHVKPKTRQIPRLRQHHRKADPVKENSAHILPDYTVPVIKPLPDESENFNPDVSVPEFAPSAEDIPGDIKSDVAKFSPPVVEEAGGVGSRMDYLDMVRFKIDRFKKYPPFSRGRNIEGQVMVVFNIDSEGYISGLDVAVSSGFPSLDRAALSAVNNSAPFSSPPKKYFTGLVRVKVPIVFELIQ